jgi:hypothetical protein
MKALIAAACALLVTMSGALALSQYAEDPSAPIVRTFTCWYYDKADENRARSFDVEASTGNALHACFKTHREHTQGTNNIIRRT